MASDHPVEPLREQVIRALVEQLESASFDWSTLLQLSNPVLRIEASIEEGHGDKSRQSNEGTVLSHLVDLSSISHGKRMRSPRPLTATNSRTTDGATPLDVAVESQGLQFSILPTDQDEDLSGRPCSETTIGREPGSESEYESNGIRQRKELSGLRPARAGPTVVEAADSQRQIHSGDRFPKRRKQKAIGHVLQPSTLDKLVGGIWEQLHGSLNLDPQSLLDQLQLKSTDHSKPTSREMTLPLATAVGSSGEVISVYNNGVFSQSNLFCRQVTQASRACRSLEVIVQARWVEYFDAYVDNWAQVNTSVSRSKLSKAALMEACADFGWSEKELRNKMHVWRGYKEIKDAGGWVALVFAGMGIYRFCKYRIGFEKESMQRLRNLRMAMEVTADTLHPHWRQLLSVVGDTSEQQYSGHPHDWVVFLDGTDPIPLRNTYLQWDPNFSYKHIEESVIDESVWGCDDPRWTPPTIELARAAPTSTSSCETCGKEQSDDPKLNSCYCFPTLFGGVKQSTSPVLVFRTANGRNNGLLALCAFERGAPVGEFVGVVTKGLQGVDVMESSAAGSSNYQIWQGRQGNFTRFVNHSCKANAQYQRFTWLNTQRIVLVSKGISAGTEVTVDYSDKYWRGLDKECLCGESCCRYNKVEANQDT